MLVDIPDIRAEQGGSCREPGARGGASGRAGCGGREPRLAWSEGRGLTSAGGRERVTACLAGPGCWRPGLLEGRSWGWRLEVEDLQLGEWRRSSWSRAREPRAGQSEEALLEVEVLPGLSIEARGLVEAGSRARHQGKGPGVEGSLPGGNCSVVSVLQ